MSALLTIGTVWILLSVVVAAGYGLLRHITRAPGVAAAELAADLAEFKVQQEAARGIAQAEQYLRVWA